MWEDDDVVSSGTFSISSPHSTMLADDDNDDEATERVDAASTWLFIASVFVMAVTRRFTSISCTSLGRRPSASESFFIKTGSVEFSAGGVTATFAACSGAEGGATGQDVSISAFRGSLMSAIPSSSNAVNKSSTNSWSLISVDAIDCADCCRLEGKEGNIVPGLKSMLSSTLHSIVPAIAQSSILTSFFLRFLLSETAGAEGSSGSLLTAMFCTRTVRSSMFFDMVAMRSLSVDTSPFNDKTSSGFSTALILLLF
mmetsp:Transcript_19434/g.26687  ORF Transcript_19434/g.26687 Transcript_19434/m.26687 type:complete len:255 (-) Transcript_19434:575-1339(-)